MTRQANARLAGFMFLFYIATALPEAVVKARASGGASTVERLANIAAHTSDMRWVVFLNALTAFDAILLGLALYGLTRETDHELALFALLCRSAEGVINATAAITQMGLLSLATAVAQESAGSNAIGAFLLRQGQISTRVSALCFAVGSLVFAWLLLRARSIPVWLAWTGVIGSALLVAGLPALLVGVFTGIAADLMWIPVAVFEIVLGFRLLIKGDATPGAFR